MTSQLAGLVRAQSGGMKQLFSGFGALQSVTFKGVGQGGMDIYEVVFEKAKTEWRIELGPDGKTAGLLFRPM